VVTPPKKKDDDGQIIGIYNSFDKTE